MSGGITFGSDGAFWSGIGESGVWRNNQLLISGKVGQTAAWGIRGLYQSTDLHLRTCNQFGDSLLVDVRGVTFAAGSQTSDYWAAFLADGQTGVYDARTFQWPMAGLLGVIDDVIFLKTDWNTGGISAWRNGSMLWGTANAQPSILTVPQFSALDANRCIWCENGHLAAYGLTAPAQTELVFDPFVLEIGGALWLGYHSERVILRRWGDASQGYILEPAGGYYTAGRVVDGSHIEVAWSRGPGAAGDVETYIQDLTAPMVPLVAQPPIPIPPEPIPVPPDPHPQPPTEEPVITIGQKGQFRRSGSNDAWKKAIVIWHQDEGMFGGKPVIRGISTDLSVDPNSHGDPGHVCFWKPDGSYEDTRPNAGEGERTSFDGLNIMIGRPDSFAYVYDWVNLS